MNHAWIALLFPLFLSPQSEASCAQSKDDAPSACCKKTCKAIEKALAESQKAVKSGMRGTQEALVEAQKQLEQALQTARISGMKGVESLKALNLSAPLMAYTLGKDGQLAQIQSSESLQKLMEKLHKGQHLRAAERKAQAEEGDEDDEGAEAAESAEENDMDEANDDAELAQLEASANLQKLVEKSHKGQGWWSSNRTPEAASEEAGEGQSRELEERVAALEQRFGVHRDGSQGSLEERVAALERLAPAAPGQPLLLRAPRMSRPGRVFVAPRTPKAVVVAPPAVAPFPGVPEAKAEEPTELWERSPTPKPAMAPAPGSDAVPPEPPSAEEAPRALELPRDHQALRPGSSLRFAPDRRREVEVRMRKMREEMERLREEMSRLREELGRESGGAR